MLVCVVFPKIRYGEKSTFWKHSDVSVELRHLISSTDLDTLMINNAVCNNFDKFSRELCMILFVAPFVYTGIMEETCLLFSLKIAGTTSSIKIY